MSQLREFPGNFPSITALVSRQIWFWALWYEERLAIFNPIKPRGLSVDFYQVHLQSRNFLTFSFYPCHDQNQFFEKTISFQGVNAISFREMYV